MKLVRKLKTLRLRTLLAVFLLLALCVGVVAQSMREAQLAQEADAREIQNTGTFVATDNVLSTEDVDKAKVKKAAAKKKKARKKKKAKAKKKEQTVAAAASAESAEPAVSIDSLEAMNINIDREFDTFVRLTKKADQERISSKKVSDNTKLKINETRDKIVAYCKNKMDAAQLANNPDQVAFYDNVSKQITARAAAACSNTRDQEALDKAQSYTEAKNKAFNRILQRKKPSQITPRQKAYLERRTIVILEENMKIFLSIISQVLSLINQAQAAVSDPVSYGVGCALSTAVRVAAGGSVLPPEIEMLRYLSSRLQTNMDDYKAIQNSLYILTGRPPVNDLSDDGRTPTGYDKLKNSMGQREDKSAKKKWRYQSQPTRTAP